MVDTLLEPIAAGQTRFRMPGLAPDARGIAVGREALIILPSFDRLVGFLGSYSQECSLDELLPTMTIERGRRVDGGHALLVRCSGGDSYALDRLSRLVLAVRGQLFTGSASTFVRVRERSAPFGYDLATAINTTAEDIVAVELDYAARYRAVERLDPVELIQRLSLRPIPMPLSGIAEDPDLCGLSELALVLVAPGISERVLSYLWNAQVTMAGVRVALEGERRASLLLRLRHPPGGILDVLHGIPGVELLAPVSERAAVELGYAHPIHLAAASSCLPGEEMYLFRGRVGRVERLEGAPRFLDGRYLVESKVAAEVITPGDTRIGKMQPLKVGLRLRPSASLREPRGALIPWEQAELLRRIIYTIPPTALSVARLAAMQTGLLVLTGSSLGGLGTGVGAGALIPLGTRVCEVAPGVLVPDGYEIWPRVRPSLVRELLGLEACDHALFSGLDLPPIRLRPEHLIPLDSAMTGHLSLLDGGELIQDALPGLGEGDIDNTQLGRFALWGFGGTLERGG